VGKDVLEYNSETMKKFFGYYILPMLFKIQKASWFFTRPRTHGSKTVLTHKGKVLLVRHTYGRARWTFPGGGIKRKEDPKDAAKREAMEEVNINTPNLIFVGDFYVQDGYKHVHLNVFTQEVESDYFKKDDIEIKEAKWFDSESVPELGPNATKVYQTYKQWKTSS